MAAAVLYYICLDQSWFCSVWACPLALGWIEDKVHSEASVLVSQPSDPLKEKEFIVQMLACHLLLYESHSPQQNSIRKAKLVMILNLIFLFSFSPIIFSPFCIDSNALNSVVLVLNLNDSSMGLSASEWTKGVSCLCAVRILG